MPTPLQANLLRRTTVALATVLGLFISLEAPAASVVLTGAATTSCTYNGTVSVTPDGGLSINCTAVSGGGPTVPPAGPTPGPGTFAFANSSISATAGQNVNVPVTRTNGSTGSYSIPWGVNGAGCAVYGGTLTMADAATSGSIQIQMNTSGTCSVYLLGPSVPAGATVSTAGVAITVGGSTTTPTPPTNPTTPVDASLDFSNCPSGYSAPVELINKSLGGYGNPLLQMQRSMQVVTIPLPQNLGVNSGVVQFGESAGGAYTPQPVRLEISINRCPGLIEDAATGGQCSLVGTNGNYNAITWFNNAYQSLTNRATAGAYGYCWAGDGGKYYINARWTYTSCAFGAQVCGFAIQHNQGPY